MSKHIYAVHDWSEQWGSLVRSAGKTAWAVITEEIGDDRNNFSSADYRSLSNFGVTPIVRLNYSHHGQGTIPLPDRYAEFAIRCRNFVHSSQGCTHWVIGNEPNLIGERPAGVTISPEQYARCYRLCRQEIKKLIRPQEVIVAAIAPYNVHSGSWIVYHQQVLEWLEKWDGADGIALHCYSRGGSPQSVFSEGRMDYPYQDRYNGFRAYMDFLRTVPASMRNLPVYITETDQIEPWLDRNSGWVKNAYQEIDDWNKAVGTQKIFCLALYRWFNHDQWAFSNKPGVTVDFAETLTSTDYRVPVVGGENIVVLPQIKNDSPAPKATITAPAGANIRSGPGTNYALLGAVPKGQSLPVTGKNSNGEWWQVISEWGKGWVSGAIVKLEHVLAIPVVTTTAPMPTTRVLDKNWMVSAWSRVLGIEETVSRAVLAIESGGRAFEGNRMIIRFENHVFLDSLNKLAPYLAPVYYKHFQHGSPPWTGHKFRLSESSPWNAQHDGGQAEEWQVFELARNIHEAAAMCSISMGMAQILGSNYRTVGYSSVQDMFYDYNDPALGEYNQLTGFFAYVVNVDGLLTAMRRKDWRTIAHHYNGSGNVDYYAPRLQSKYKELGGTA